MAELSISTDYFTDHGDPSPYLRRIAEAGFSHVHWCHHWRSDFLYSRSEMLQIGSWLTDYGLQLNDVHGSEGIEKFWYSPHEYVRKAGVELVENRLELAARLGGDAIVMHIYPPSQDPRNAKLFNCFMTQLRRSLDDLQPLAMALGVKIAVENLIDFAGVKSGAINMEEAADNFDLIEALFTEYPPDFLGHCYDSGHANLGSDQKDRLNTVKDRLTVLHLNDNDGTSDDHRLLFQGTVNWLQLATVIVQSAYDKPLSFEVSLREMNSMSEESFLKQAHLTASQFSKIVEREKAAKSRMNTLPYLNSNLIRGISPSVSQRGLRGVLENK